MTDLLLQRLLFALVCSATATGCTSLPAIPLTTPKPIEVNLNMRLDVYQYSGDTPDQTQELVSIKEAVQRQRNRMEQIQVLKNNRFIGENHRGLLQLREVPAGDWGDYVKRTVEEENQDRTLLMRSEAKESNRALHEVEFEQWRLRADQAFKGEYIEIEGSTPSTYEWVQSTGPSLKTPEAPPAPTE